MKKGLLILLPMLLMWGMTGVKAQEIATWYGFSPCAVTFTFDDGAPSHITDVAPLFDSYGYKASFYLVTNWNPNWTAFTTMADNGHEIGSHSKTHGQNMTGEEASSKQTIEQNIPNHSCLTVAYPNCNVPNETAVLQNYIGGRICNGSWQGLSDIMGKNGPDNWAKVPAILTGSTGTFNAASKFTDAMDGARQTNGWVMFLTHGLQGKNNGNATYSPTDINAIEGALRWAKQNEIWVTSFCNAAMYCKERMSSEFTETARDASSITYSLVHSIADNVCRYEFPLTLRVLLPEAWTQVEVLQDEESIDSQIKDGFIYFDAVPNGGEIVVRNANADGLEDVISMKSQTVNRKIVRDGQLYLLHGEKVYTSQGQEVR